MSEIQDKIDAYMAQCNGTYNMHTNTFFHGFQYTDGVKFVADALNRGETLALVGGERFRQDHARAGVAAAAVVREIKFYFENYTIMLTCER